MFTARQLVLCSLITEHCKETGTDAAFLQLVLGEAETVVATGPRARPITQARPCGTILPEFPAPLLLLIPAYYLTLPLLRFHLKLLPMDSLEE